ncbi:MAG TPA: hypothetical protein VHR97_01725 [Candidatus Baltobacteraceae bacterium]|jgi:hypothetical protein|nr:hypothetical protein [Candidatus Baltobacteraceae bacterium]
MPIPPNSGRWPRRLPDTNSGEYYVDNRNPASGDKYDRRGPYVVDYVPGDGQLQVPTTTKSGDATMVLVDAHIWLPVESGVKARSIIIHVPSGAAFTVLFASRQGGRIEALVQRRSPS